MSPRIDLPSSPARQGQTPSTGLAALACRCLLGLTLACAAGGLALGSLAAMSRIRGGAFASRLVLGLLEDGWLAQAGLIPALQSWCADDRPLLPHGRVMGFPWKKPLG